MKIKLNRDLISKATVGLLCLTPLIWFFNKTNFVINGVDTNFPLNPIIWFQRRLYVWNAISNGGSDFSSSVAGLFFHLVQVIPNSLGTNLQVTQIVSLVFWFSSIVLGAFFLSRTIFPKKPLVQLLFTVLYTFNIYLFNTWENIKVSNLSLVAALPFALTIFINLKNQIISIKRAVLYSILVGVLVSGTGINPAYFVSFVLTFLIFILSEFPATFRIVLDRLQKASIILGVIVLFNAFWIIPTGYFIFTNITLQGSLDKIGFSNWINSLSENTSLLNVLRGQGAWDWYAFDGITGLPLYIPYALRYFHSFPFLFFSFIPPLLSILSLIFIYSRDESESLKKPLYRAFAVMLVIGVFLGSGSHLPTGGIYNWMLAHLPFFSLFRSPWYIFSPMTLLGIAGLVSLLFAALSEYLKVGLLRFRIGFSVLIVVFIIVNLAYNYPLLLGKIFRAGRYDSFYIKFPDYLKQTQDWLSQDSQGRVIGYPDDEIERFSWGYRGIESILNLFSNREVLYLGLNAPDSKVSLLIKDFYKGLKKQQITSVKTLASMLNIEWIFEKGDQESLSPNLSPEVKNWQKQNFDKWTFYKLPDVSNKIYSVNSFLTYYPNEADPSLLEIPLGKSVLTSSKDTVMDSFPKTLKDSGEIVVAENSQQSDFTSATQSYSFLVHLGQKDPSKIIYNVDIPRDSFYNPILDRYRVEDFGLDFKKEVKVILDGIKLSLQVQGVDDSFLTFSPIKLTKGKHTLELLIDSPNLVSFVKDNSSLSKEGEGEFKFIDEGGKKYLSIFNTKKQNISAVYPVSNFDPYSIYLVKLKYKQIYGNTALLVMGQSRDNVLLKSQAEGLPSYPDWIEASFYYQPLQSDSKMTIKLVSPEIRDPLGTRVFYDDLAVYKIFTNKLMFLNKPGTEASIIETNFKKISPVLYSGTVKGGKPHFLVFLENYSPDWKISFFNKSGKKIIYNPLHFTANLYANGWFVQNMPEEYDYRIYYSPQNLFNIGIGISLFSILTAAAINITGLKVFKRND